MSYVLVSAKNNERLKRLKMYGGIEIRSQEVIPTSSDFDAIARD
jgi:hypothetical protein